MSENKKEEKDIEISHKPNVVYYSVKFILGIVLDIFFREIEVVGKENIPNDGAVIFVGNHPNQFVDGMMMFTQSPRDTFMIIAESSLRKYALAGGFARLQKAIPVYRREDAAFVGTGTLSIVNEDLSASVEIVENDDIVEEKEIEVVIEEEKTNDIDGGNKENIEVETLGNEEETKEENKNNNNNNEEDEGENEKIKTEILQKLEVIQTTRVIGHDSKFSELKVGDQLHVKIGEETVRLNVMEVVDDENLIIKGSNFPDIEEAEFKVLPKLDQSQAYRAIYSVLKDENCIGIFPEGGSSDRVEIRQLKVGVAYLALSTKKQFPDLKLTIVPFGLNYIGGHRFRSKTLIEYGAPLTISKKLLERFCKGDKKAVHILTDQINSRLRSVTLNIPSFMSERLEMDPFEAKDVIITARRLYQPSNSRLPVAKYLELNRRFAQAVSKMSDEPKLLELMTNIKEYNADRKKCGLSDRQAENAPPNFYKALTGIFTLIKRSVLLIPCIIAIPGVLLHLPVGGLAKYFALQKAKAAAKRSSVKIEGRDVIASNKIVYGFVFIVAFYSLYGSIASYFMGSLKWFPVISLGLPVYSYFCIKYLDRAAVTIRSTVPLVKYLFSPKYRKRCHELRETRKQLQIQVRKAVKEFGPRIKEYWEDRVVADDILYTDSYVEDTPFSLGSSYIGSNSSSSVENEGLFEGLFDENDEDEDSSNLNSVRRRTSII